MTRSFFAALVSLMLLASCGNSTSTSTSQSLEVTDLYIIDPAGGRDIASAFMTIKAEGGDYRFIAASAEDAVRVELHTHDRVDGQMQMRQVDGFDISAGETLQLARGGRHLMLFGWDEAMQPGDEAELLLVFQTQDGDNITLSLKAEVRDLAAQ